MLCDMLARCKVVPPPEASCTAKKSRHPLFRSQLQAAPSPAPRLRGHGRSVLIRRTVRVAAAGAAPTGQPSPEEMPNWDPEGVFKPRQGGPTGSLIDRHLSKRGGVVPAAPQVRGEPCRLAPVLGK